MNQLEIHKRIDNFFSKAATSANINIGRELVAFNLDSKKYFFSQANEDWFDWLNSNGFLDKMKVKATDQNQYSYTMPELEYLTRVAGKKPGAVADFIIAFPISNDNFNPEVIDRFLWIIEEMPAEQIKRLSNKIKTDNWVFLMRKFNKSGYQFHKIITKLSETGEHEALLDVAEVMLSVRTKADLEEGTRRYGADDVFYLDSLSEVKLFESLANIDNTKTEEALSMCAGKLSDIIKLKEKDKDDIFEYEDYYILYDKNLFELELRERHSLNREDFENLIVVIKKLTERTIGQSCGDAEKANRLLAIITDIPSCRLAWKLKLFALTLCPEVFKAEIKDAFLKIFSVGERYFEIEGGAEYHETLNRTFSILDEPDQREYVRKVFDYFLADLGDKDKEGWRKRDGSKILGFIHGSLTTEEKRDTKEKFGIDPDNADIKPEPISSGIKSGSVIHRAPDDISSMTIDQIIEKLKGDYRPEEMNKKYKGDDIFNPRCPEGVGDALQGDIKKRPDDYLIRLNDFFDRNRISSHYVYSLLRGVEEMLRDKAELSIEQVQLLLAFFKLMANSGSAAPYQREKTEGAWLANWVAVHKLSCDILLHAINNAKTGKELQTKTRAELLELIKYFLAFAPSPDKQEEREKESDLFSIAINSVRGRAYEVFVVFAQIEGKELAPDIKEIFTSALKDESLAVRFVIGRYLASFYFRDKDFISGLLPEIFPKDNPVIKDVYLATWEGYLSNTLYSQLFDVLGDYYEYAISLSPGYYTDRKYFKDMDEALAVHLALAYAHLDLKIEDPLFKLLWETPNPKRHKEFISFIGRSCLSRGQAGDEWLKKNNVSKEKLILLWDYALDTVTDREALSGFGFWVNYETEVIDDRIVADRMAKTMSKSSGLIDWDYGLMKRLPALAGKDNVNTILIIKNYLLDASGNLNPDRKGWGLHTEEIKQALEIIYKDGDTDEKRQVEELINTLIDKGSSTYWGLKDILNK